MALRHDVELSFIQGLWKPSGAPCVLEHWTSGGSWPAALSPVSPNLRHSLRHPHPPCHWVNSQVSTYGAFPPCRSPSSAHWLLRVTLAQSWCWECWWSRCRLMLRSKGSAQFSDPGSPLICLSPGRPQLHIGCRTKDLFVCLEWSFEVKPGCRATLPGQMHLVASISISKAIGNETLAKWLLTCWMVLHGRQLNLGQGVLHRRILRGILPCDCIPGDVEYMTQSMWGKPRFFSANVSSGSLVYA